MWPGCCRIRKVLLTNRTATNSLSCRTKLCCATPASSPASLQTPPSSLLVSTVLRYHQTYAWPADAHKSAGRDVERNLSSRARWLMDEEETFADAVLEASFQIRERYEFAIHVRPDNINEQAYLRRKALLINSDLYFALHLQFYSSMPSPVIMSQPNSWLSPSSVQLGPVQVPLWISISVLCALILYISVSLNNKVAVPLINGSKWLQPQVVEQINFVTNGLKTLAEGRHHFGEKPYRMITHMGEVTVLPPSFATIIRNEWDLDLRSLLAKVSLARCRISLG
jgi:hypothetical protein